jgi:DNA-binding transcriptional LysR family regulator
VKEIAQEPIAVGSPTIIPVQSPQQDRLITLEDLRTFVEVADAGGVSPGVRRLGVSKSIVSRRLARLEEALGVQLLSRTTRGAALTEAGATFREHAVRVVAKLDAAQDAVSPEGDVLGLLRIAAPLSFGPTHLAPVFAELAHRHPLLHVHAAYSDRFFDLVGEGFDAGVRVGCLPDSSLVARRICAIRGKLVASPGYIAAHRAPQTPEDLLNHEALMQGTESWRFVHGGKTVVVRPRGRVKADNGAALLAAALAGLGVAGLPDFLIEAHIASGALIPLLGDYPPPDAGLYVVRPPGDFPPRKVRVLIDILIEHFGSGKGPSDL